MYRYVVTFSKSGPIRYISHLDMLRLFKRAFRRADIELAYSHGYNPHPKMGFAQPLSLGYDAEGEYLEVETSEPVSRRRMTERLQDALPEDVRIVDAGRIADGQKSLAASVDGAIYSVDYPLPYDAVDMDPVIEAYLAQDSIMALKRQKKTKQMKETDIRSKIRRIQAVKNENQNLRLVMELDCGSASNLSPELVISTFDPFASINCERYELDVCRNKLILPVDYSIQLL